MASAGCVSARRVASDWVTAPEGRLAPTAVAAHAASMSSSLNRASICERGTAARPRAGPRAGPGVHGQWLLGHVADAAGGVVGVLQHPGHVSDRALDDRDAVDSRCARAGAIQRGHQIPARGDSPVSPRIRASAAPSVAPYHPHVVSHAVAQYRVGRLGELEVCAACSSRWTSPPGLRRF